MLNEFLKLGIVKKLPNDCLDIIKKYYNISVNKKNRCVLCNTTDINYYDYIDGLGYICLICNVYI